MVKKRKRQEDFIRFYRFFTSKSRIKDKTAREQRSRKDCRFFTIFYRFFLDSNRIKKGHCIYLAIVHNVNKTAGEYLRFTSLSLPKDCFAVSLRCKEETSFAWAMERQGQSHTNMGKRGFIF